MKRNKTYRGNAVPRMVLVGLSVVFQTGWLILTALVLNEHYPLLELLSRLLSVAVILQMNSKHSNAAFKMPWIMLIMAFPVMGLSLYGMFTLFGDPGKMGKRIRHARSRIRSEFPEEKMLPAIPQDFPGVSLCRYLQEYLDFPVYGNTQTRYFPEAAEAFASMKEDLEKAESFIFMEYFIVSADSAFRELGDILLRKAKQGVDVRLMYDDVGSVGNVNLIFARQLMDAGIRCMVFNPAIPVLNVFMNHRDHRKITVIDGKVGYTGGYNLADEYFGRKTVCGRWKDTGLRLEGNAVRGLTEEFLEMWSACSRKEEPAGRFLDITHGKQDARGFVQPYGDNPLEKERVAESIYLQLIHTARKSLYIITPYLIITDEMTGALAMAAKRGVDVRIVTPGIPDKKLVYALTRSYYAGLAGQGVRIYEYSPGFCHAKQMLCDGKLASIGTSNLDYRSLYLHFENNVLLYDTDAVEQMARDFEALFPQCREVTAQYSSGRSAALRAGQHILRLFAPLL